LDEVVIGAGTDVTAASGDDARRYGAVQSKRVADREHPIADARSLVRKFDVGKVVAAIDLDQGNIGACNPRSRGRDGYDRPDPRCSGE